MAKKKEKKVDLHKLTPEDQLKYEIAEELGLLDKVVKNGWKSALVQRIRENRRGDGEQKKTVKAVLNCFR